MTQAWADQSLLDRMVTAVERVRDRLKRATAALESAGVPYAVVGGNAVAAWVATIDAAAVRNTQDVDVLLRRSDLDAAAAALATAGFVRTQVSGVDLFLDGPAAGPRDAVHVVFAGEPVRPDHLSAAPDVADSEKPEQFRLVTLEALVRMKLTAFRRKDQVHLLDLIEVGLVDERWLGRVPPALAARLKELLESKDG